MFTYTALEQKPIRKPKLPQFIWHCVLSASVQPCLWITAACPREAASAEKRQKVMNWVICIAGRGVG